MALSGHNVMSAIRSLSGVKRTSPRDGCRSIQKHPLPLPSLRSEQVALTSFGPRLDLLMMDQQPHPAVAAVSAHFAR